MTFINEPEHNKGLKEDGKQASIFYVVNPNAQKVKAPGGGLDFCDPMDCSPPDSSVYGISQARLLEWVADSFSRGSSQCRDRTQV